MVGRPEVPRARGLLRPARPAGGHPSQLKARFHSHAKHLKLEMNTAPTLLPSHRHFARVRAGWLSALVCVLVFNAPTTYGAETGQQAGTALPIAAASLSAVNVAGTAPMAAAATDLVSAGYTEREFYAWGKASRYRGAVPGAQKTAEVIDGNWSYRTRVLVRTPPAAKFNGTLVVEWANVTVGQDIDFAFAESYEYLLREGYAVAVVSAQRLGVDRLKTWSPNRYGDLTVTADNTDPQTGAKIDECIAGTACPGDPLSWDILTQVSKALKENALPAQPLPGLTVRRVIALGESQSAGRLSLYYNAIHPLYKFFDGFVMLDRAQQMRPDLTTPAISVNTESSSALFPATTTAKFTRVWDVAGASHASIYAAKYVDDMLVRDNSFPGPSGPMSFSNLLAQQKCSRAPLFSTVDTGLVLNAALNAVRGWVETGKAAAPTLQFKRDDKGAVIRDAEGKVQGGVQLPQFVAPTAFLALNGEGMFCVLAGHHRDFSDSELKSRYGSHQAYVSAVRAAMKRAERQGYVLPYDAKAAVRAAESSKVAR